MVILTTSFKRGGRPGGDKRGNAATRRARKYWMLFQFGNGVTCPCSHCGTELGYATVEADRIVAGGSYCRKNVIPACRCCNVKRSDKSLWQFNPLLARRLVRKGIIVSQKGANRV